MGGLMNDSRTNQRTHPQTLLERHRGHFRDGVFHGKLLLEGDTGDLVTYEAVLPNLLCKEFELAIEDYINTKKFLT